MAAGVAKDPWADTVAAVDKHAADALADWGSRAEPSAQGLRHLQAMHKRGHSVPREALQNSPQLRLVALGAKVLRRLHGPPGPSKQLQAAAGCFATAAAEDISQSRPCKRARLTRTHQWIDKLREVAAAEARPSDAPPGVAAALEDVELVGKVTAALSLVSAVIGGTMSEVGGGSSVIDLEDDEITPPAARRASAPPAFGRRAGGRGVLNPRWPTMALRLQSAKPHQSETAANPRSTAPPATPQPRAMPSSGRRLLKKGPVVHTRTLPWPSAPVVSAATAPVVSAASSEQCEVPRIRAAAPVEDGDDSHVFRGDIPTRPRKQSEGWSEDEEKKLMKGFHKFGKSWEMIRTCCGLKHRTGTQLREKWRNLMDNQGERKARQIGAKR
eukprot:gnl/TRDRNA2_/TRDRNA2_91437_c0_seq3.p1 gnl/TRDRNA2_/TRDRNA2_91437_c0~~gnl/TRDRNA2_/TRDRNA2_91437_c0_seq3.p1  ORF type:complete len:385 (+),score=73.52 gnl/TRDRNA2_/TRDRNA2_91437_c0_seq3:44-1198(+)